MLFRLILINLSYSIVAIVAERLGGAKRCMSWCRCCPSWRCDYD